MKKLFAIVAVLATAILAACSSYDMPGAREPETPARVTPPSEDEPTPTTTPDPDPTPDPEGLNGTIIEKLYYRVSDDEWPSIIVLEMTDGSVKEIVANLPPSLKWGEDVYSTADTLTASTRLEFDRISEKISDWEKNDSISTRTVERHYELKASTFVQTLVYTIREATVMINGKEEPFLTAQNVVNEGNHEFSAEKQEFEDGGKLFERELNIVKAFAKPNNVDVIEAEGKGFVDREVSKEPEKVEEPAEEPVVEEPEPTPEPTPEPEPEPDPVVETPVVEVEEPNIYVKNLKEFVETTMVMDGNDNFYTCKFFDCGEFYAADIDRKIYYFAKNSVNGTGYNSVNWDTASASWVPAVCGSLYDKPHNWYYSTALANGTYIDRSCDPNYASTKGNDNFSKDDHARTTWKVQTTVSVSELNGKRVISVTTYKPVIEKTEKVIYGEE